MVPFAFELASRALKLALDSMSTSILALACPIAYWLYRGVGAFLADRWDGIRKHFFTDAVHTLCFGLCWWAVLFGWFLWRTVGEIKAEVGRQRPPMLSKGLGPPRPPTWADELTPPALAARIRGIEGFSFVMNLPPGNYGFENKKEYELIISNLGRIAITSVELEVQTPLAIVVSNVASAIGADGVRFQPSEKWSFAGNGSIGIAGCPVSFSNVFQASRMGPGSVVRILLVLESNARVAELPSNSSFIFGHFDFLRRGATERQRYYAPFAVHEGIVVLLPEIKERATMTIRRGFMFDPPPCIPSDALR